MTATDLHFNGIDAESGRPLTAPSSTTDLAELIIAGAARDDDARSTAFGLGGAHLGVVHGCDPEQLDESGWAIIAAADTPPDVLAAILADLRPLLDLRRAEAGPLYREFVGADGFRRGDTKRTFLQRHGAGANTVANPVKVPYHLLLCGGPESIPFEFQYQLAAQYAVGRLDLAGGAERRAYAARVAGEPDPAGRGRSVGLFGPANDDDPATRSSRTHLVEPLRASVAAAAGCGSVHAAIGASATKDALLALLGAGSADVVFAASHGLRFAAEGPHQRGRQGALLCQDWPGPTAWQRALDPSFYVCAADVQQLPFVGATVMMAFACYGAGTPLLDEYPRRAGVPAVQLAREPFVAALPRALLGHRAGRTVAFVGHVERTWGSSFVTDDGAGQAEGFDSVLRAVVDGVRIGHAMEPLWSQHTATAAELADVLDDIRRSGRRPDSALITRLWLETNDARGLVVLGDPAVRAGVGLLEPTGADDRRGS